MATRLIYDYYIHGHHLEYLHHLYQGAIKDINNDYVFYLPQTFESEKNKFKWDYCPNVRIVLSEQAELYPPKGNYLVRSIKWVLQTYSLCTDLNAQIKKYNASSVFLISLFNFLPFLPLLCPRHVKVSGIIYGIYFYYWKNATWLKKSYDLFVFYVLRKCSNIDNVYMLNDSSSANYLNRKYKVSKFKFLPDPVVPIPEYKEKNLRNQIGIPNKNIVFLHLGGMSYRKGTMELLRAIEKLSSEDMANETVIFAGRITPEIKDEFMQIYKNIDIKGKNIILIDGFLSYEYMSGLCSISDFLILPYRHTSQSSGIIGYAAQFRKPVIVPNRNLLGKLVRKYKLGYAFPNLRESEIYELLKNPPQCKQINSKYMEVCCVENFLQIIFNNWNS